MNKLITGHLFQVNQLIDEETKRYRGSKKYLEHLPPVVYDKFLVGFSHPKSELFFLKFGWPMLIEFIFFINT